MQFLAGILAVTLVGMAATSLPVVINRSGTLRSESIRTPALDPKTPYSFHYAVNAVGSSLIRWDKNSAEYNTILDWINGAKE